MHNSGFEEIKQKTNSYRIPEVQNPFPRYHVKEENMDTNLNSMRSYTVARDKIQYQSSKFFRYIFLQQCAK